MKAKLIVATLMWLTASQSAVAQTEAEPLYLHCKSADASEKSFFQEFTIKVGSVWKIDGVDTQVLERWEDDEWDIWLWESVSISSVKIASFTFADEVQMQIGIHRGLGAITKHIEFEIDRRNGQFTYTNHLNPPKITGTCSKTEAPKPPPTKF
jgi:hypothetical protein